MHTFCNNVLHIHVDENCPYDVEPFRLLSGESIEFMGLLHDEYVIAISNYRLFTTQEDGFYSVRDRQ